MRNKKLLIALLVLLTLALAVLVLAKPLQALGREIGYYLGTPTDGERQVHEFAREKGIPYSRYPEGLIHLLDTNPETKDFVLNFPFRENIPVDVTGCARDTVPLFLQWDPMWGYERYGANYLAVTGCGPTCLAMAGYYLTGDPEMNPLAVARFAEENGYYKPGYGSSWTLISEGAAKLGLEAEELPLVKKKIVDALNAGSPVILALGKGDFTTEGHYIVLTAAQEGGFRVNDPNSPARSSRLWTYEELEPQIKNIWAIRAD